MLFVDKNFSDSSLYHIFKSFFFKYALTWRIKLYKTVRDLFDKLEKWNMNRVAI